LLNKVSSILWERWSRTLFPDRDSQTLSVIVLKTSWLLDSKLILRQLDSLDNFNSVSGNSVVTSHFVVHLVKSTLNRISSVFLEHILVTNVGVILEIDTEVLGLNFLLSKDLLDFQNFSVRLFDLVLSSHDLPELRFGKGSVWSNDFDDGDLWLGLTFRSFDSSVDQEFSSSSAETAS